MISYQVAFHISFLGIVFFSSLILTLFLTPIMSRIGPCIGLVDCPDCRKVHKAPIPRSGGLAIIISFSLASLLCLHIVPFISGILIGGLIILAVGLMDDLQEITPAAKFGGQILAALTFIMISGRSLYGLGNLLGVGEISFGLLSWPLTVFAIVGVINSFNLSDGLDGLSSGLGFIGGLFLAILACEAEQWHNLAVIFCLLGTLMGFLRFNNHPANLFMGDTGSLFLGFALSCLAISMTTPLQGQSIAPIQLCAPLWIPISDTLVVMSARILKGKSPFHPDKTHLHHKLMDAGFTHRSTVSIIYTLSIALAMICWGFRKHEDWVSFIICFTFSLALYLFLYFIKKKGLYPPNKAFSDLNKVMPSKYILVAKLGQSVKYVRVLFLIFLIFPVFFLINLSRPMGMLSLASALLIITIYPWRGDRSRISVAAGSLFYSCFFLLFLYHFHKPFPGWGYIYLHLLTICAFLWSGARIMFKPRTQVLLPSGFEILLLCISWFIPVVVGSVLPFAPSQRIQLMWACFQAIPAITVLKLSMADQAKNNSWMAMIFCTIFIFIGILAFV